MTCCPLGGSSVVISGVRGRVTLITLRIRGRIIPLITTHEPPRKGFRSQVPKLRTTLESTRIALAVANTHSKYERMHGISPPTH